MNTKTALPEFLPCPFCGGPADWCRHCADEGCHRIECSSCGMQFDSVCDKANNAEDLPALKSVMIQHWNARQAIAMNVKVPDTTEVAYCLQEIWSKAAKITGSALLSGGPDEVKPKDRQGQAAILYSLAQMILIEAGNMHFELTGTGPKTMDEAAAPPPTSEGES